MKNLLLIIFTSILSTVSFLASGQSISGSTGLCVGSTTSLVGSPAGGTWTSSTPAIAVVTSTGEVNGIYAGTTTITYTPPAMAAVTTVVTVYPTPGSITGPSTLCYGTMISLGNTTPGGSWASSNTTIATIGASTGVVSGITAGTATISYILGTTGCAASHTITVNPAPSAITGATGICVGLTSTLTDASSGGTWSSSNASVAPVGAATGIVSGAAAGTAHISYTLPAGCSTAATVTVTPYPASVIGPGTICVGATASFSTASSSGVWISGNTAVATVGSSSGSPVPVTGVGAGTAAISYVTGSGCATSAIVTVIALPVAGTISGPAVICISTPASLSATVPGGIWASSLPATADVSSTGLVTAFTAGSVTISYTIANACGTAVATMPVTTSVAPAAISGTSVLCTGATTTLSSATPGGTWSSSGTGIATITPVTGAITGITGGITTITYAFSSACYVTAVATVNPSPSVISGTAPVCIGSVIALSDTLAGGTWASSNPAVATIATIGASTGVVTGVGAGTAVISYAMSTGCATHSVVTVNPLPVITASFTPAACGGTYLAVAGGGTTYSWSPADGLSCATCATTTISPSATTIYSVTGTGGLGCSSVAAITVDGNRIFGHISFSGPAPSAPGIKIWLIQYNPADSSLTATDSMLTCLDGDVPFYEFSGKPAGAYMVKARLLSSIEGATGYVPTYSAEVTSWTDAASASHINASDSLHITMVYGTVPAGPGFISGNIYSGAGKGTASDVPVANMLVYLKDAVTGSVITYAYTNGGGAYSFGALGNGSYIVYPEDFSFYTTPSSVIVLSDAHPSQASVNFKEHSTMGTITPYGFPEGVRQVAGAMFFTVYPNPSAGTLQLKWHDVAPGNAQLSITDMTGRDVMVTTINMAYRSGDSNVDLTALENGIYFFNIKSAGQSSSGKLMLQK